MAPPTLIEGPSDGAPALSVVLVTKDSFATIRKTVSHLRAQTVREAIELVVVAPSRSALALDHGLVNGFACHTVVEVGVVVTIGAANAAGIGRARARIVALAEDHCFPDPAWAESLIRTHTGPWVAVGPAVRNANPATAVSWADLFIGYGPWLEPVAAGEVEFLPGHNTSYKRGALLDYGDRLESLLGAETVLHWDLRSKGHRLYLEPAARVAHTNFSLWSSWIPVQFLSGRVFAGTRRTGMSPLTRAVYVLGSPLIPLVRLVRLARAARAPELRSRFLRYLPAIAAGLVLDAAGQMVGYALGAGDSPRELARYEFRRIDHLTARDRREVFGQ